MLALSVRRILVALMLALAVSYPNPATPAQALRVSIKELKENWRRYTGKTVQVRGELDACGLEACNLCPQDMKAVHVIVGNCILAKFAPDVSGSTFDWRVNFLKQQLYKFATVTLEARFNGTCYAPDVLCLDGPAPLTDGHVLEVHSRKSVLDGLAGGEEGRIIPASAEERTAMMAEFRAVVPYYGGRTHEVFQTEPMDYLKGDPIVPDGVACICLEDSCTGKWPVKLIEWMNSPANPFPCWLMKKRPDGWRVLPGFWGGG